MRSKNDAIKLIRLYLLLAAGIAATLPFGCAPKNIVVEDFHDEYVIDKGEEAVLRWQFGNSDFVRVEGYDEVFESRDSLRVEPVRSREYRVTAYRGSDSMPRIARVFVGEDEIAESRSESKDHDGEIHEFPEDVEIPEELIDDGKIRRGPDIVEGKELEKSYSPNDYVAGLIETEGAIDPAQIKAMRYIYGSYDNDFKVRALALDEFGNVISGYGSALGADNWTYTLQCADKTDAYAVADFSEYFGSPALDMMIAVENSEVADENESIYGAIEEFAPYLSENDKLSVVAYNQNYRELTPLVSADKAIWEIKNSDRPETSGLSAFYKTAFLAAEDLSEGAGDEKALVMIAYNADNASILYRAEDAALLARKLGIPIYIIGVGAAIKGYELKSLTDFSGGKFYYIEKNEIDKIKYIFLEIATAQKLYYEIDGSLEKKSSCSPIVSNVSLRKGDESFKDRIRFVIDPIPQYSQYQSVSIFDYREVFVPEEFRGLAESLAEVMKDNPSAEIELTGHAGVEGTPDAIIELSERRAMKVKELLVSYGVDPRRILVKAEGSSQPVYFLEMYPWQKYYNRRVEVRWLDPALLPFEIVAGFAESESLASEMVETWENRGYRAYYDRYLKNDLPVYRVKLWGYATALEAEAEVARLESEYSGEFRVD